MYKYVSIVLVGCLGTLGVFYVVEKRGNDKAQEQLNNQISKLQGVVKETETAYSSRAIEAENLKSSNSELNKKIKDRDENIAALGNAVLEWKDKYYKISDAHGSVVDPNGNPTVIPPVCEDALKDKRFRVDFDQTQDNIQVKGYTLTNPSEAYINLHWTRPLNLEVILTKDKDNHYKVYIDPKSANIVPTELSLKVDESVLEYKWFQKIQFNGNLDFGQGVLTTIGVGYDILDNFSIGPNIVFLYDGGSLKRLYGVSTVWYPFR